MGGESLVSIAEELYGLVPGEFTGTRNEWARRLKADGDRELADRVASLRRPSLAAWVVNLLMRREDRQMAQVLELGAALRTAQEDLDGDALRELGRQRRALTSALSQRGRVIAGELGVPVGTQVADQVQATLHAAMIEESSAAAVRSGLLVTALSSTGVSEHGDPPPDAVAVPEALGSTPRPRAAVPGGAPRRRRGSGGDRAAGAGKAGLTVVPDLDRDAARRDAQRRAEELAAWEARRREALEAVDAARGAADEAREQLRSSRGRRSTVQARTLEVAEQLQELANRVAALEHELEGLDQDQAAAEEEMQAAQAAYDEARERLDDAHRAAQQLEGSNPRDR